LNLEQRGSAQQTRLVGEEILYSGLVVFSVILKLVIFFGNYSDAAVPSRIWGAINPLTSV
jgi:hypothetical protein